MNIYREENNGFFYFVAKFSQSLNIGYQLFEEILHIAISSRLDDLSGTYLPHAVCIYGLAFCLLSSSLHQKTNVQNC